VGVPAISAEKKALEKSVNYRRGGGEPLERNPSREGKKYPLNLKV